MIKRIQEWYKAQCDGDWEHDFGVVIQSLDNPGWAVDIDLVGTRLDGAPYDPINQIEPEEDWIVCEVKDGKWKGRCGPLLLDQVLLEFLKWADEHASRDAT